ncbi:MAG: hypothetical protein KAR19_04405 [Bacteroidales bacterium]|nr:hypothetical protein [Bacteroidales bacterium]
MFDRKIFTLMVLLLSVVVAGYGQSKKNIREKGIVSKTVHEYFIEEGMDEPVVESIERFNEEGDVIEIQEFNRKGEVRKWEKYMYNDDGKLVEEVFLDAKGRIDRTEKSIYEDNLRVEKQYYNNRGKLYKKKKYLYEYSQ